MFPPEFLPSAASVHDGAVSPVPTSSSSFSSIMAVATTSLAFSIATAPAINPQTSMIPSTPSTVSAAASATMLGENSGGECELLGPFAILVQAALGALALLSLVYKRWRERPQRPLKVWSFDVSKQVVGSILLHLANLVMSLFSSGHIEQTLAKTAATTLGASTTESYQPNPCTFYLLNLAIDTTIGIPILIVILKVLTVGASYTCLANPPESIISGHYGRPPNAAWWLKQCLIYFLGLLGMKTCVFIIFQLCPWLERVGDWALRWTEGNEAIQVAFVMLIFPLLMNAVQYYIIDTFIKERAPRDEHEQEQDHGQGDEQHGLLAEEETDHGTSIDEDDRYKSNVTVSQSKYSPENASYDPDKDGEMTNNTNTRQGEASSLTSHAEAEAVEQRPRI